MSIDAARAVSRNCPPGTTCKGIGCPLPPVTIANLTVGPWAS